ncbi:MAG: hypothetical protein WC325_12600, partial [Candidatus Bathyarchaeia archaeon]
KEISYDDKGEPARLLLVDLKGNRRYETGKKIQPTPQPQKQADSTILPPTPIIPTPEPQKTYGEPKNEQKTLSAVPPQETTEERQRVIAQNLPLKKKMVNFAFEIFKTQYPDEKTAGEEAVKAVRDFLVNQLHLKLESIEMVEVVGRPVVLDDTLPRIQGDVPLIMDEVFWHGNDKMQGFEQFVKDRLPFPEVEREN